MKFKLKINLGSDAMQLTEDIAEALHRVAYRVEQHDDDKGVILDINGNTVGEWSIAK